MGFFVGYIAFKSYVENLGVYFYYVKIPIQQMLRGLSQLATRLLMNWRIYFHYFGYDVIDLCH